MTRAMLLVACAAGIASPITAGILESRRDSLLNEQTREQIAHRRSLCATGQAGQIQTDSKAAGFQTLSAGQWCVTVLTRAGRDGTLGYVRDTRTDQLTPAMAFDSGFVGGYLRREAAPAGAPAMAALMPLADRCLDQKEANIKACSSAGYILGLRAARGEIVPVF